MGSEIAKCPLPAPRLRWLIVRRNLGREGKPDLTEGAGVGQASQSYGDKPRLRLHLKEIRLIVDASRDVSEFTASLALVSI